GFLMFGTRARLLRANIELARAATEQERQQVLIVNTELRLLQAQIEPHFLFNTLSNIIGLIHKEPDLAEQTLLNLTTLLRSSLDRTRSAETTLAEEIEISRAYLEIHSIRMQGRLRYNIDYDPAIKNLPLAPLLVQPLVENAIKHGIDPLEQGGEISISASVEDNCAIICVADNGRGIDPHKPPSTHSTGLANVRDRLDALYHNNASLKLAENPPSGVRATLTLPLST
ncbi:MAG: sensor histidine kinase, partial [Gammaproteobacteria bacterium]|nr:sensor histidine kinase [Gammaproteobacteria bacterium]